MPMIVEHIDAIARRKQRGVLFIEFHRPGKAAEGEVFSDVLVRDWNTLPVRQEIIDWLEAQGIGWSPCGHFANESLMMDYRGQIYFDIPFDSGLPAFSDLVAFLESPDGSMRLPDTAFIYVPLEVAMKNVHHDKPGFWESWAERF